MDNIKVTILGADGYTCQIPRIKEGMELLGHALSEDSPDLIYSNDPKGYEKALILKKKYPNAYLIFNFLDIPWHIENIQKQTELLVKNFFLKADAVSVISSKVQKDLAKFYDKKIHVIYNPVKDVYFDEKIKKDNMFLYVGRANDPIKRIKLVHDSIIKIPEGLKNIKICGTENPGFGNYVGVVSDKDLNKLYNSSKFVLLPSKAEGIGLPMIEGMICGTIPVTCSDNLTAKEFSPSEFICEPNAQAIVNKIEELNKKYSNKRKLALEYGKKYKNQFNKKNIATNIIDIFNSRPTLR
jgi:glycosyltransferase involved in cell wall biosynthesis